MATEMDSAGGEIKVEVEGVSRALPDDLVERIVAMMPFPSIFKARCLSKSWQARFSPIPAEEDAEGKECLAASFQKEVGKWSNNWESCSPVFVGGRDSGRDCMAYNAASQKWRQLPSLSFLHKRFSVGRPNRFLGRSYLLVEGSLLYGLAPSELGNYFEFHVANILTQTWKQVPTQEMDSNMRVEILCYNLVLDPSAEKYKLIVIRQSLRESVSPDPDEKGHSFVQIYDSKTEIWSSKEFRISHDFAVGPSTAVYIDGVVYMVAVNNVQHLLAIHAEEGTVRELSLAFDGVVETVSVNLVVCKTNWLLLVCKGLYPETLQVLRVDLESQQMVQLARGPPAALNVGKIIGQPVGQGSRIFFRVEDGGSRVLVYNVDDDEWSCVPVPAAPDAGTQFKWISSSFQPGLSPFVTV